MCWGDTFSAVIVTREKEIDKNRGWVRAFRSEKRKNQLPGTQLLRNILRRVCISFTSDKLTHPEEKSDPLYFHFLGMYRKSEAFF